MKFISNHISTATKTRSLSEIFKAAQTQAALTKTASVKPAVKVASAVKQTVKVAEDKKDGGASDEAESSGQLKVEPLHQEGESTQQKPGDLDTMKKEEKEAGSPAGTPAKEEGEAESSGQLKVEPLHQEGESTQEKPGDLDTQKTDKEKKEAKAKSSVKKASLKKVSELTPEEKTFLKGVWSNYWPADFIDALLAPQ